MTLAMIQTDWNFAIILLVIVMELVIGYDSDDDLE
jgi:hypothetical protein